MAVRGDPGSGGGASAGRDPRRAPGEEKSPRRLHQAFSGGLIFFRHMSQDNLIKFECTECNRVNYHSRKNKKNVKQRLELAKFCEWCKKHTPHKETK
jgi:large subunit ribosomal protein L33